MISAHAPIAATGLRMTGATLAYDARVIAQDLSVSVRPGKPSR